MTNTLIQFRIDKSLKDEASNIYENIGLDLNSAIKLFLKRSILEQGLPFSFNLELDEIARISRKSRVSAGKRAKKLGLDKMTMDEINREISMSRKERYER